MGRINLLDPLVANEIKAGEVIERPVSVVKELIDNSIDAGANVIKIEIEQGGISLIRVSDNGIGMDEEDARMAFTIHATSKITKIDDLYDLSTMGFRGEALPSIAACSDVRLVTRMADRDSGVYVEYRNGILTDSGETSADIGTVVEVRRLFASIPARYKFLKKDSTESMYICNLVEKMAIVNPHISFRLIKDGKQLLMTPGSGDMLDAIYSVHGKQIASMMLPVSYVFGDYRLSGYTGKPDCVRGNRGMQYIYVNDRAVRNQSVTAAIDEAYKNAVMKNKYPVCFLCIYSAPGKVDVNVHPQKSEVRFSSDTDVFRLVYHGIRNSVFSESDADHKFKGIKSVELPFEETSAKAVKEEMTRIKAMSSGVNTTSETAIMPGQLRFKTSNAEAVSPTAREAEATANMLKILSEFKPDIAMITGQKEETSKSDESESVDASVNEEIKIAAVEDKPDSDIEELNSGSVVGFLFDTYIIVQTENSVFFVDQHAAHERVLYERFMARKLNEKVSDDQQQLLVPQIVDLSAGDYSYVSDNYDKFRENGFDIELMGSRQIAIRAVPLSGKTAKPAEMFVNIINELKKEVPSKNEIWYSLIQTTACKAAIKAHDKITVDEAVSLISQMRNLNDPYHCAHGRPTFIKVTQTDFEQNFKRIV